MTTPSKKDGLPLPEGQLRKEQLISIAGELFARKGYDGTSLRDIAESAGITKAALYYWFPEKEQLYEQVVAGRLVNLVERATAAIGSTDDPLEQLRRFMVASASQLDVDRHAWVASSNSFWSNFNAKQREMVVPLRDRFERLLRQCIVEAQTRGLFRTDIDAAMAGRLLLSGLNMLPRWHQAGGRMTAGEVVAQYVDVVIDGMRKR